MDDLKAMTVEELRDSVNVKKQDFTKVEIFAIYDLKGEKYDVPFFAHSELFAKRRFILMLDEKGILQKFLDEFQLIKIGIFNILTGGIEEDMKIVLEGKQIRKEIKENEISYEAQI